MQQLVKSWQILLIPLSVGTHDIFCRNSYQPSHRVVPPTDPSGMLSDEIVCRIGLDNFIVIWSEANFVILEVRKIEACLFTAKKSPLLQLFRMYHFNTPTAFNYQVFIITFLCFLQSIIWVSSRLEVNRLYGWNDNKSTIHLNIIYMYILKISLNYYSYNV